MQLDLFADPVAWPFFIVRYERKDRTSGGSYGRKHRTIEDAVDAAVDRARCMCGPDARVTVRERLGGARWEGATP